MEQPRHRRYKFSRMMDDEYRYTVMKNKLLETVLDQIILTDFRWTHVGEIEYDRFEKFVHSDRTISIEKQAAYCREFAEGISKLRVIYRIDK